MLRKLLLLGLAAVVLLGLFLGRDAVSYVSTMAGSMRESVRESIPLHIEIKRAHDMIEALDGPIEKNMEAIAKEEIAVEKLAQQVNDQKENLAKSRTQILRLTDDLRSGDAEFIYGDKVYNVSQVKTDLTARFERFKSQESTAFKHEQILAHRQKGLEAARSKLESMLSAKKDLEVEVADLEARQKLVEFHEASNDFTSKFDDSQLARTEDLVNAIQSRIEVAERLVETRGEYTFQIDLDDEPSVSNDIASQITDYFGDGRAEIEALVKSSGN